MNNGTLSVFGLDPRNQREKDNELHAKEPKVGDYWHEMFSPMLVVVSVVDSTVVICKTPKSTDKDHWTWDLTKIEVMSIEEFSSYPRYTSMRDKFWCDVVPEAHKFVRACCAQALGLVDEQPNKVEK